MNTIQEHWGSVKDGSNSKIEKTFVPNNVRQKFIHEIRLKYGHIAYFLSIYDKFGVNLQHKFKTEWVEVSYVEFIGENIVQRRFRMFYCNGRSEFFQQNVHKLIAAVESKLLYDVICLYDVGGLIKISFQPNSAIFDCGTLVKQYLAKAIDLLEETHKESQQKFFFNLTDRFKVMFLFFAAQLAIPNFEKAQQSFIDYLLKNPSQRRSYK